MDYGYTDVGVLLQKLFSYLKIKLYAIHLRMSLFLKGRLSAVKLATAIT